MKKFALVGLIILMVSLSACASSKSMANEVYYEMEAPAAMPQEPMLESRSMDNGMDYAEEAMEYDEAGGVGAIDSIPQQRMVIRNADMAIVVDEPADAMTAISRMAERMGGFVVSSNMWKSRNYNGVEIPEGAITVRVPAELLDQALDEIKTLTNNVGQDVLRENISGQDVTKEYTDLSSRLRNYEDAEEQLREILDAATETEDVLDVFNQLTYYREQIEVVKGQMQYYEESAALSAISVNIQAHEAVNPITVAGWKPSVTVSKALQALVKAFQGLVDALIWIILYILPILIVLAIPFYLAFLIIRAIVRRGKKKRAAKKAAADEEPKA